MNDVALKEYIERIIAEVDRRYEQRFLAQEGAVAAALAAQEKFAAAALGAAQLAVDKAEINTKAWQSASNEWRGAMSDRERNFISQAEHDLAISNLQTQITDLKKSRDRGSGQDTARSEGWERLVALSLIAGTVVAVILHFIK